MEEWMYRSAFPYPGTSCSWVVSFMPLPLYLRGKSPRYLLNRLGGPQSRSGRGENTWLYRVPSVVQPVASHHTDYAITAPHLMAVRELKSHFAQILSARVKWINVGLVIDGWEWQCLLVLKEPEPKSCCNVRIEKEMWNKCTNSSKTAECSKYL
jgi:hypothetical protein